MVELQDISRLIEEGTYILTRTEKRHPVSILLKPRLERCQTADLASGADTEAHSHLTLSGFRKVVRFQIISTRTSGSGTPSSRGRER